MPILGTLGGGAAKGFGRGVSLCNPFLTGEQSYTTPGTYSFTVPAGVCKMSAVCIGGGGGGGGYSNGSAGGGALGYKNDVQVSPGEILTVVVGSGGSWGGQWSSGSNGGNSTISRGGTGLVGAEGGIAATPTYTARGPLYGSSGGYGGHREVSSWHGAGGGAGGYTGNGGGAEQSGSGGGGGGGAPQSSTSGITGSSGSAGSGYGGGGGGSSGTSGTSGASGSNGQNPSVGGTYGGGGASTWHSSGFSYGGTNNGGGKGGVRIIWGTGRSFPNSAS